jgi:hypothetical protein
MRSLGAQRPPRRNRRIRPTGNTFATGDYQCHLVQRRNLRPAVAPRQQCPYHLMSNPGRSTALPSRWSAGAGSPSRARRRGDAADSREEALMRVVALLFLLLLSAASTPADRLRASTQHRPEWYGTWFVADDFVDDGVVPYQRCVTAMQAYAIDWIAIDRERLTWSSGEICLPLNRNEDTVSYQCTGDLDVIDVIYVVQGNRLTMKIED